MRASLVGASIAGVFVLGVIALLNLGVGWFGTVTPRHAPSGAHFGPLAWLAEGVCQPIPQLLLQLVIIVLIARIFGSLFEKIHQPPVIGEMLAGIVLGPTVVGALFPAFSSFAFPKSSLGNLQMLSQVGIMLFMFVVGMELNLGMLKHKARAAILISQVSIAFPYFLGVALSLLLYKEYAPPKASFIAFALFLGISMSITAFPVLARIIKENGLSGSNLGTTAISCAAIDDVSAWCILAFIVALAKAHDSTGSLMTFGLSIAFLVLIFLVVKPALEQISNRAQILGEPPKKLIVICLLTLFTSALYTEAIGIHGIFGAFVAGVAMPKSNAIRTFLQERLEYFSTLILVPIFFVFTGLRTQVGLVTDLAAVGVLLLIIGAAVLGKFGGGMLAARYAGMSWRDSAAIGALMNTRGLIELIALNIGLDLGIISPKIFTMLVIMALVTTCGAGPVLSRLGYGRIDERAQAKAVPEGA